MSILSTVKRLEGQTSPERNKRTLQILKRLEFNVEVLPFQCMNGEGRNLKVRFGNNPRLLITAVTHVVNNSPGANNSASGVAVLIDVLKELRRKNAGVSFDAVFLDKENNGLSGSSSYSKEYPDYDTVVALQLLGKGGVVTLWPVADNQLKCKGVSKLIEACKKESVKYAIQPKVNMYSAAFAKYPTKDGFGIVMVPEEDVEELREYMMSNELIQGELGVRRRKISIMRHFRELTDTSKTISESSMKMASRVLQTFIKLYCK